METIQRRGAKPAGMATYGPGENYTPGGRRALIQLRPTLSASVSLDVVVLTAARAHAGRQAHVEEHVGRAYEDYDDFKRHRNQTLGLRASHGHLSRQLTQHVRYSTSPERTRSGTEGTKKGRN